MGLRWARWREGEVCRVTMGHLRAIMGHIRVTLGHLTVTIGYFFLSANIRQTKLSFTPK